MTGGRVVVVGAGLAGVSAVRALRRRGFTGEVLQFGAEPHRPYDRPPLSKEFLDGRWDLDRLALEAVDERLQVELRLGVAVRGLDLAGRAVLLDGDERVPFDGLVVATGARARTLAAQTVPDAPTSGVHTLRTLDDALALRTALRPGARCVVVGAGLLGAEVASTARARGCEVTVVEAAGRPLVGVFGAETAARCVALHGEHGVRLLTRTSVVRFGGDRSGALREVELDDGRRLPADLVVVAVGAVPQVEWLADSGLALAHGVLVDASGVTSHPGVVAVGDCAAPPDPLTGRHVPGQHWTAALEGADDAVVALLGVLQPSVAGVTAERATAAVRPPYVWSSQYGVLVQSAGRPRPDDVLRVVDGDVASASFVGVLERPGPVTEATDDRGPTGARTTAVVGMNGGARFARLRKQWERYRSVAQS